MKWRVELFNCIPVRIQQALSGKLPPEFFSDLNEYTAACALPG